MYYKITNTTENHHGFQYRPGLNVLKEPFSLSGFYYTDISHILNFLDYGIYLRKVSIPRDASVVQDGDKWRSDKIILQEKYLLGDLETFRYLYAQGAPVKNNVTVLEWAAKNGYLTIVKYVLDFDVSLDVSENNGFSITSMIDSLFRFFKVIWGSEIEIDINHTDSLELAAGHGHLEVVKYLVSIGSCYLSRYNTAVQFAAGNGHLEVIKYLFSVGANIYNNFFETLQAAISHDYLTIVEYLIVQKPDGIYYYRIMKWAVKIGNLDILKILVNLGYNILTEDHYAIRWASRNGHLDMVSYLVELGVDVKAADNYAIKWAIQNKHYRLASYLAARGATIPSDISYMSMDRNHI